MSERFSRIKNFNVSVKELKDNVLFLRKLTPGGSQHSFGIHVAKMAGMPPQVIKRATALLKSLEKSGSSNQIKKGISSEDSDLQLSIFKLDDPILETLRDDILALDIDTLTPVEALMKLNEIKRILTQK
jgi:DNA mismatch repair protein MutS